MARRDNLDPCWESNPAHPACSLVTILTELPRLLLACINATCVVCLPCMMSTKFSGLSQSETRGFYRLWNEWRSLGNFCLVAAAARMSCEACSLNEMLQAVWFDKARKSDKQILVCLTLSMLSFSLASAHMSMQETINAYLKLLTDGVTCSFSLIVTYKGAQKGRIYFRTLYLVRSVGRLTYWQMRKKISSVERRVYLLIRCPRMYSHTLILHTSFPSSSIAYKTSWDDFNILCAWDNDK
jgi:hypothetical protein